MEKIKKPPVILYTERKFFLLCLWLIPAAIACFGLATLTVFGGLSFFLKDIPYSEIDFFGSKHGKFLVELLILFFKIGFWAFMVGGIFFFLSFIPNILLTPIIWISPTRFRLIILSIYPSALVILFMQWIADDWHYLIYPLLYLAILILLYFIMQRKGMLVPDKNID